MRQTREHFGVVAFDAAGARLGYGKGCFDRLLRRAGTGAAKFGLAFTCQILERIPVTTRDVFVDYVVTESALDTGQSAGVPG